MAEFSWQVPEVRVGQDDGDDPMDVEEHHIELEQLEQQRQLQQRQLQLQDDTPTLVEQPAVLCYEASDDETTPPANGSSQKHQQLLPLDCDVLSITATNGPDSASGCSLSSSSIYRGSLPREGALPLSLSPASSLLAVPGQAAGNSRRRHSWICR